MNVKDKLRRIIIALSFTNKNRCATSDNSEHMQRIYNNHHNKLLRMREILKEYEIIEQSLRHDVKDVLNNELEK